MLDWSMFQHWKMLFYLLIFLLHFFLCSGSQAQLNCLSGGFLKTYILATTSTKHLCKNRWFIFTSFSNVFGRYMWRRNEMFLWSQKNEIRIQLQCLYKKCIISVCVRVGNRNLRKLVLIESVWKVLLPTWFCKRAVWRAFFRSKWFDHFWR